MRKVQTIFFCFIAGLAMAQTQTEPVELAGFVVSADNSLDTEDFMSRVLADSSFYQAFLNLKYIPHQMKSQLRVKNKGEKEKAKQIRTARQVLESEQRKVEILTETTEGKLYKRNGEHRYLTAEMYEEVFFPLEAEAVSPKMDSREQSEESDSKMEKYRNQLKKMMFNPGQEILSVPFIGDKMDIFSEEMRDKYNFSVYSAYTNDSIYCHVFEVVAKDDIRSNQTVIKEMVSYFDKTNMDVISREYRLVNNTLFFEFDIWMKVENDKVGGQLLPRRIQYDGDWDIPFKSAEIIRFDLRCTDYDLRVLQ